MKKTKMVIYLILIILTFSSCKRNEEDSLLVSTPGGAVGISHSLFYDENYKDINIDLEIVEGTTQLNSLFSTKKSDVIIAPNNLGVKFYNSSKTYLYAGSITWGNCFIVTTSDNDFTINDLNDKTIYIFGEGSIPALVIRQIVKHYELNTTIENLGDSTSFTQQKFILDPNSICMISEPALCVALTKIENEKKIENFKIIDIQEEWEKIYGNNSYPQAGVFINKNAISKKRDLVNRYLKALEDCKAFIQNNKSQAVHSAINNMQYVQSYEVLYTSIERFNIDFIDAKNSKEQLINLLNLYLEIYPDLIEELPEEGFYYINE